ncbi:Thioredoxin H-type [Seminavis robusta]|uniref:Thioredoxin n=1 Tax=Seminavis robusta TaxID=568900 RepID=A0A9N8H6G4_9STRA|nr:Thioredoxin H-type [Seminavis robusta]|eukprot:Sro99_g050920.1 Thioredoxin H-type (106) ;mRNA; f:69838-70486
MVNYITSMDEFNTMLETSKSKAVIIDFTATWCPPCKMIGPIFEGLAKEYTSIEFFKVDVDDAEEVAAKCGIQAMPTFQVFKDGAMVDEMKGASEPGLKAILEKHK